ncbi:ATP-grasp domain-containing protein [Paenibacillus polysaccharolyticus]|uniref:ATP-grasp domain-containing protein n=1 Tax=Paenibacillus polysaccharolyticus TaxID=582692 RepID=UPI00203E9983|nr:ATP-grasp domain-containing protein [Paenibacillus polysaccharolyticus]MCM3131388.1 ATP-grasp domain-containing protein [Paenibacillus polysaccharolyticus]
MTTRVAQRDQRGYRGQTGQSYRVLLTGGRAPVTLDLARMLHRSGHLVFIAESMEYHLCRRSSAVQQCVLVPSPRHHTQEYLLALEHWVKIWQIDVLIPMCEEVFYVAGGAERLRQHCRVLVSSLEQLHVLHHKYDFNRLAKSMGLSAPDTHLIQTPQEWMEMQHALKGEWVWKPVYSRFAAKVRIPRLGRSNIDMHKDENNNNNANRRTEGLPESHISASQKLHALHHDPPGEDTLSPASPWVAQRYIHGRGLCTYSVVHEGHIVAHAAYDNRYRTGSVGASVFFEQVQHEGMRAWVERFVAKTGFSGQIGFDFIEDVTGQVYAIECNPRATSGIHLFHPGNDLVRALLEPEVVLSEGIEVTPRLGDDKAMLALPMLGSGIRQIRGSRGSLRAWGAARKGARDVVYMRQDRRPFVEQFAVVLAAWRLARSQQITLTEALTHDIEWNGEQR